MLQEKQNIHYLKDKSIKSFHNIIIETKFIELNKADKVQLTSNQAFIILDGKCLRHFGIDGQDLSYIQIQDIMQFKIVGDQQVLAFCRGKKNVIFYSWNFITGSVKVVYTELNFYTSKVDIKFFKQSNILCLLELSDRENSLLFYYFKLPIKQNSTPFCISRFNQSDLYYLGEGKLHKMDNHSMFGFSYQDYSQKKIICLYTFCLNKHSLEFETKKYEFSIKGFLEEFKFLRIMQIYLINDQFYLQIAVCSSFQEIRNNEFQYHDFYWNYEKKTLRKSSINKKSPHFIQFVDNMRQFHTLYKIQMSFNQQYKKIPLFYINSQNQKILAIQQFNLESLSWDFPFVVGLSQDQEQKYEQFDFFRSNIKKNCVKIYQIPFWAQFKIVSTFLLTEVYPIWDDDLLYYVGQLLQE